MATQFINQLLSFITTPVGIAGSILGLLLLRSAIRSRRMAWFLLSLCCFAASIVKFQNEFILQPPPLVFPLQQLREVGRPLTIVLIALIIIVGLQKRIPNRLPLPFSIKSLIVVQVAIFIKTVIYGSIPFALLAIIVFGAIIFMITIGPLRWLDEPHSFYLAVWSMAMVGILFIAANSYQAVFNLYPITFIGGRFLGTTGNPQQAAILLASVLPCLGFLAEKEQRKWVRLFWLGMVGMATGLLLITGSRTGVILVAVELLVYFRFNIWKLLRVGIPVILMLWLGFMFLNNDSGVGQTILKMLDQRIFVDVDSHFTTGNSRRAVWDSLWYAFRQNPIFGMPLGGERMGFGESSWLATAAGLGLVGLLPLFFFSIECLKIMGFLFQARHKYPESVAETSVVLAGLAVFLVASVFEALLLGNLSVFMLMLMLYLVLGQYLVTTHQDKCDPQTIIVGNGPKQPWNKTPLVDQI